MAVDKLVDSAQLDADLTSVADAIRAKGGGSGGLAFPAGFVSAIQSIPSGGTVSVDTKTATASNYPRSLSFTGLLGEPKMFALRLNVQVSSSGSTTYYYIVDIIHAGSTTHGNCFRIGSTRRIENITTGYTFTYSNGTLTVSSSASSRSSSPGAFYSGSYELIYVY